MASSTCSHKHRSSFFRESSVVHIRKVAEYFKRFYSKYSYTSSLLLSSLIVGTVLFYRSSQTYLQNNLTELFEFVEVKVADRKSSSATAEIVDPSQVEAGIEDKAVDIAFLEGVKGPQLIGSLKRNYPKMAAKAGLEAVVVLDVIIDVDGRVVKAQPIMIKLSKALPIMMKKKMEAAFALAAMKMLMAALFTRPEINGENVPIKLEVPLDFFLDN